MNICHITRHACPRTLKLARVQQDLGHKTFLITNLVPSSRRYDGIDHITKLERMDSGCLVKAIQAIEPLIDIWHYHNNPDWPVPIIKAMTTKPVIYDVHDIMSALTDLPYQPEELDACRAADGILTAGRGQQEMLQCLFPHKLFDNYPPALPLSWFPQPRPEPSDSA